MREEDFRRAIADPAAAPPHERFAVYRRNVDGALGNALAVRFPATEALLGRSAFLAQARRFAAAHLPRSPVLIDYGEGFADVVASDRHPYLGDVARLENAWWRAYHAPEAACLDPMRLAVLPVGSNFGLRFTFHPSASLVVSRWAVGSIWDAVRSGRPLASVAPTAGERVVVWRRAAEVLVHAVAPARATFLSLLMAGQCLADAVEATAAAEPAFDLVAELQTLVASSLLVDFIEEGMT